MVFEYYLSELEEAPDNQECVRFGQWWASVFMTIPSSGDEDSWMFGKHGRGDFSHAQVIPEDLNERVESTKSLVSWELSGRGKRTDRIIASIIALLT